MCINNVNLGIKIVVWFISHTIRDFCLIRILGRIQHADTAVNGYTWPRLPSASGRAPPAADPRNRRTGALPLHLPLPGPLL